MAFVSLIKKNPTHPPKKQQQKIPPKNPKDSKNVTRTMRQSRLMNTRPCHAPLQK